MQKSEIDREIALQHAIDIHKAVINNNSCEDFFENGPGMIVALAKVFEQYLSGAAPKRGTAKWRNLARLPADTRGRPNRAKRIRPGQPTAAS